tara:strand:- start:153 stop:422 length:270 start_codon:yes stop_codon:yes gene_type:complete
LKKLLLVILLTFSSLSFGAISEYKYEAFINPNEMGIYILNQGTGSVKFCQAVSGEDGMVTGCTDFSGEWGLSPNPFQQELMNELLKTID